MTEFISQFHFIRPLWFLALIPAIILLMMLFQHHRRSSQWTSVINEALLPYLLEGETSRQQKAPLVTLILLWVLATLALAGPAWEKKPQPIQKDLSAMVILWDLSPSMYTQDIKPSRLQRARLKLVDLLNQREEGLTALIAYAGDAHVVTPLTDDVKTIKSMLPGLEPGMMPSMGSNPEEALRMATELFKDTGIARGDIIFMTDGISAAALDDLQSQMKQSKHRVTVWGIGTAEGAPIPLPQGGFAKRTNGDIVVSKLDENLLYEAASAMAGMYIPFSTDDSDIEKIQFYSLGKQLTKENHDTSSSRLLDQWLERGYWLVLFILPFAALAFRRGWLMAFCCVGLFSPESQAVEWDQLWKNSDQRAQEFIEQGDAETAANTFKDEDWQAIANYKAGNFEAAETLFRQGENADAKYNLANTLTHQGRYDEAIAAYDKAIELKPDFQQAIDNKKIAEQLKQMQEQQNQQQQDGDQQNQDQKNQENQENQENSQQSDSQNSDSQQSDSQQSDSQQSQQKDGQNSEEQQQGEENQQQMSQEQKEALDKQYKQQAQTQENEEQQDEQQQAQMQQAQKDEEGEQSEQAQKQAAYMQMSEEEKEEHQALEQWLRRVPDDPSGLLRNKFQYEHEQRRREAQTRGYRNPNVAPEDRW